MARKDLNIFSMSFLDCICCGFGAVVLLFVIINARSAADREEQVVDLRGEVNKLQEEMLEGRKNRVIARNTLEVTAEELVRTEGLAEQLLEQITEKKEELANYENDTLASKEHINKLKADLKSLEEDLRRLEAAIAAEGEAGSKVRSVVGEGDRQYLTGVKVGGKRVFILVDASASMLAPNIVDIIRFRNMPDARKRLAPKWQQALKSIDWLTAQLPLDSQFQLYTFNETAQPVLPDTRGKWLKTGKPEQLNDAVAALNEILPENGTSLINGFRALSEMTPPPDNIFLLVDSLPTMGERKPLFKKVSGAKRVRLFHEARAVVPLGAPINVILFPMEGDPVASSAYWRLAVKSRGSFFSPSPDWP